MSLNGSAESSQNFSFGFLLADAEGRRVYQSSSPPVEFVPLQIWVRAQNWSEAPQRKGALLDYEVALEFESAPTSEYSRLELAFPAGFNVLAALSPLQGFNPDWGLKKVGPHTICVFSQRLADSRPLFSGQTVSFRLLNVPARHPG